jgi:DNA-directed RNA polymerase specialized sigma24 family protein
MEGPCVYLQRQLATSTKNGTTETRKAGGERHRLALGDIELALEDGNSDRLLALDEALRELEIEDPRKAKLVKLRFFAGLTSEQAAAALGVSISTAEKDWAYARSWLRVTIDRKAIQGN